MFISNFLFIFIYSCFCICYIFFVFFFHKSVFFKDFVYFRIKISCYLFDFIGRGNESDKVKGRNRSYMKSL